MINQFKMYFIAAAILGIIITTWSARGWYEDGKVVDALKTQKEQYEKQAKIDADALTSALLSQKKLRKKYRSIRNEASKTDLCSNDGADFLRLFNRGATAANAEE